MALKVRAIKYAQLRGHPLTKTGNEVKNMPILNLNNKLGHEKQADWITYEKVLTVLTLSVIVQLPSQFRQTVC